MGTFREAKISEIRVYENPADPENSDYNVGLPITVTDAVFSPDGRPLTETLKVIEPMEAVEPQAETVPDDDNDTFSGKGSIPQMLNRITGLVKGITGKSKWWQKPVLSVEEIDTSLKKTFTQFDKNTADHEVFAASLDNMANKTDIASNEVAKGASLIGIADVDGHYESTTAEGALKERAEKIGRSTSIVDLLFTKSGQEVIIAVKGLGVSGMLCIYSQRVSTVGQNNCMNAQYAININGYDGATSMPIITQIYKYTVYYEHMVTAESADTILVTIPAQNNNEPILISFLGLARKLTITRR